MLLVQPVYQKEFGQEVFCLHHHHAEDVIDASISMSSCHVVQFCACQCTNVRLRLSD